MMSKREKVLTKILRGTSDTNISFDDLRKLLLFFGFHERIRGSHYIFSKEDVTEIINLQSKKAKAKAYQVNKYVILFSNINWQAKKMIKYEVILYWSEDDQAFIAEAPELPGCMSDGESYQQALANLETIIQEWIETARELGREIPVPKGRLVYA